MSDASSRDNVQARADATPGGAASGPQHATEPLVIRHLRAATEYRGHREALLASGAIREEWLPTERIPGQRMRATLRSRDGGRDVFVRRLEDGRYCVLVILTPSERAEEERAAFGRFMGRVLPPHT
jgi:hypothetical protein